MNKDVKSENRIIAFDDKTIRRVLHNSEWFYSIIDIVGILTQTSNPRRYWSDLKRQLFDNEGFSQLYEKNRTTEITVFRW